VKTLVAEVPAWRARTDGPVEANVVLLPQVSSASEFQAWLPQARGKFVLIVPALLSCRPDRDFEEFGTPGALGRAENVVQCPCRPTSLVRWNLRLDIRCGRSA